MKSLRTLIKLTKANVEEKQKSLADSVSAQDQVKLRLTKTQSDLENEKESASKNPELATNFGAYVEATLAKIARIKFEIADLEKIIELKREALREAFAEQKRYEIALDIKLKEQADRENKLEQNKNDEIATQNFIRKKKV